MPSRIAIGATVATIVVGSAIVRSTFQAPGVRSVDEKILREYAGVYQWGPNAFVYLQMWKEFSGFGKPNLVALDASGEVRTLYPTDRDRFFAGPGAAEPTSIESRNPAVILVHASGAENREHLLPFARFLVRHGMAVVGFDKRGVGGSTGDWTKASFDDLAGDAIAAFEYLKTRADIQRAQVGMLGRDYSRHDFTRQERAARAKDEKQDGRVGRNHLLRTKKHALERLAVSTARRRFRGARKMHENLPFHV